jgi:hypothetical protein
MSTLFRVSNTLALPFWALMILLPGWRWTERIMRSPFISAAPAALYAALVLPRLGEIWPAVLQPTLSGVAALLGSPPGATIAWVHFLAFDLFVGRWVYLDSQERRINVWLMAPVLFLTLMLGPAGFILYLVLRFLPALSPAQTAEPSSKRSADGGEEMKSFAETTKTGARGGKLRHLLHRAGAVSRPLTLMGGAMLLLFLASLAGIVLDQRVITGAPAWLKPAKFAISVSVYCFTFVWLLGFVENRPRLVRLVANFTVVSFIVEMIAIVTQAARGTTSHFNMTTPFNSFLWGAMGPFILLVWTMNLVLAVALILQDIPDRAFAWSLRLGVLISAVGMAAAYFMVIPTRGQVAAIASGHGPRIVGAHSVGVADGGPGLPVVGWSTIGGDLRVAHFFGLHALQVLPFLGWLVTRRKGVLVLLTANDRLTLVWTGGLAYLSLVLLFLWQALRGQSVVSPDAKTIAFAGALAGPVAISISIIVARVLSRNRRKRVLASAIQILSYQEDV